MNGIEKIEERIASDSRAEIEQLESQCRAECEQIRERYEELAQKEYWAIVEQGAATSKQQLDRLNGVAALEAKKSVLALKQELLTEAFDRAMKAMQELPEAEYAKFLAMLAAKASRSGAEKLVLSEKDRKTVGEKIVSEANRQLEAKGKKGGLKLSDETAKISGGVILADGKIEINSSFEMLIASYRESLQGEVAKILFD